MSRLSIAFVMLTLSLAASDLTPGDLNSMWRPNNILMTNIDNYYELLAVSTTDANNQRKRFVSVLSQAYMYYVSSEEPDVIRRVQEAVAKTKKDLDKPTDAIAAQARAYLVILKTPIDQPINDVKASCPPQAKQIDCLKALKKYHKANRASCIEYDRNLRLYNKYIDYVTDPEFADFVAELIEVSDNCDKIALYTFTYMILVEYPEAVQKGREAYKMRTNTTYPCNVHNLPLF